MTFAAEDCFLLHMIIGIYIKMEERMTIMMWMQDVVLGIRGRQRHALHFGLTFARLSSPHFPYRYLIVGPFFSPISFLILSFHENVHNVLLLLLLLPIIKISPLEEVEFGDLVTRDSRIPLLEWTNEGQLLDMSHFVLTENTG